MPRVGFEPQIAKFELAKTVQTLDRAPTVIGTLSLGSSNTGTWSSRLGVLDEGLITVLCKKKLLLQNPKKWKPVAMCQNLLRKGMVQK
jgi:hypothetical protein